MAKSHVTGRWLSQPVLSCPSGINARIPRLLQWQCKEGMHEVIAWVWGICPSWERNSTVHLGSQRSRSDLITLRHGVWACKFGTIVPTAACRGGVRIGGVASGVSTPQASEVGMPCCARVLSVGWFIQDLDTSLTCSGLGPPEGGIVYGLFSTEALYIGKASVSRTHSPGLAAHLTEHFQCLYRPGLKDASKLRCRLLRRKLWSVRFFPLAGFPTISQTLAAEALATSMEALMGNARDAAEEAAAARGREREGPCAS